MSGGDESGVSRRTFLGMAGAAGALASCSANPGPQKLIPYLVPPESIVPGVPLLFRTVCRECTAGCGVTARTREGRVVKLEGNPDDPIGRGALCARGQAALQRLYAPDRLRGPRRRNPVGEWSDVSWDDASAAVVAALGKAPRERVRLLTRPEPGSVAALQRALLQGLGAAPEQRVVFEPHDLAPLRQAGAIVFGREELPAFDLAAARTVISFGADFVETWLSPVELARGLAAGRGRVGPERTRLVWIGPRLGLTGASADSWLAVRPGSEHWLALGLLRWLCDPAQRLSGLAPESARLFTRLEALDPAEVERQAGIRRGALVALGQELAQRRPSALLGPGTTAATTRATELAVAIQLINYVLGNVGRTVLYGLDPLDDPPAPLRRVTALLDDMRAGRVDVLLVHHADPLGSLPAAFDVAGALARVPLVVTFSDIPDATTPHAHLALPDNQPLESFADVPTRRGVVALAQPAMVPLAQTRSASQVLMDLLGQLPPPAAALPYEDVFAFVQSRTAGSFPALKGDKLAAAQRGAQERGGIYTDVQPPAVTLRSLEADWLAPRPVSLAGSGERALLAFPTPLRRDGGGTPPGWLQEIPDAMTTISWTTWLELSPGAAQALRLTTGDVAAVTAGVRRVELPVYVYPGLRDDVAGIPLGAGEALGLLPQAYDVRSAGLAWLSTRVELTPTGRRVELPLLEGSADAGGRTIVRTVSVEAPTVPRPPEPPALYPPPTFPGHRWAMAIDMDRCTSCQACVAACYAENNVPVLGPEFMRRGRAMGWIRNERYFRREGERLRVDFLLMLCQQCGNAPCEPVCPVYATYTTEEGLNAQVYNRCVGTRYCSNNCPYKVRVFNWREPAFEPPLNRQLNPDVTVRSKGVMEKCTFCAQRIRAAELRARDERRPVREGEIVPACAQTCPTQAIVFGDANDPGSRVARLLGDGRSYRVLDELNTRPAITYLARVTQDQP